MKTFDELLEVAAILNGPEGCAWDRKQTFQSLQPYVLEEAHEVIEAVDANVDDKIIEELGDLLYTVVFYGKVAQKEGRFTLDDVILSVKEKLIRRHPYVFGEEKIQEEKEIEKNWDAIKKAEKGKEKRESALDGIPPTLPSIAKAQKIIKVLLKAKFPLFSDREAKVYSEQDIGEEMLHLVWLAERSGIDAESAFRRVLSKTEEQFRSCESKS